MRDSRTAPTVIFFDLDDTLLDDRAASSAGLRALMERVGHPSFTAARHLWDVQTDISFGAYITGRLTFQEQRRERVRALTTQAGNSQISDAECDELYQVYLEAHRASWHTFDDVAPALSRLATSNIGLGVITNGVETLQREKLTALGILNQFHDVVCADAVGVGKPDARVFEIACQRLGVAQHQCWHIGDQMRADALGAVAAGIRPILINRYGQHTGPNNELPNDITTIERLDGLVDLAAGGNPTAMTTAETELQ